LVIYQIFFNKQELDPLFIEKSYYITPGSIDEKGKKEKPSSSTIIIQDKVYSLLVKVLHDTKKVAIRKLVLKAKNDIITRQRPLVN
jgi:non-homologous end joining protein Ku